LYDQNNPRRNRRNLIRQLKILAHGGCSECCTATLGVEQCHVQPTLMRPKGLAPAIAPVAESERGIYAASAQDIPTTLAMAQAN
jgi:hypothetical protein